MLMGGLVTMARQLAGRDDPPTEVHFKHEPPSHRRDLEGFFGCKVVFGSLEHTVVFDGQVLLWPVLGHDPELCASLQREAEAMLAELTASSTFRRDVTDAIYREIGEGNTSIRRVASRLGMHPKALARALRADGTTYSDLMEKVRLHLARRYLEQPHVSVTEVAFRLGYSEKSAFNRAFKRWTGQAPEDYRNDHRR
jgi:AraC-like DNA-binding protein